MKIIPLLMVLSALLLHQSLVAQELSDSHQTEESRVNKWRISTSLGYGWRVANFDNAIDELKSIGFSSSAADNYIKNIKSGYKIAGQAHYMFWDNMGLGVDYNFFHSSANIEGYVQTYASYNSNITYLKVEDNVFTNYVGASLLSESRFGKDKFRLGSQFSLGYTMYRDEVLYNQQPTLITGNTLGMNFEIGLEYFVISNLSIGANACYFISSISKIKVDDGNGVTTIELGDDEKESLNRLDASFSLNYYF